MIITTPLFIDIETVPDEARLHLFDLPDAPDRSILGVDPAEALDRPVRGLEIMIADYIGSADANWLDWLKSCEVYEGQSKNRAGIFAAIEKAVKAAGQTITDLSVTPEYLKIVCLGYAVGDKEAMAVIGDEEAILAAFWGLATQPQHRPIVGFNLVEFDLPAIQVRSALLGVKPPQNPFLGVKPWDNTIVDLMKARFPRGRAMGLKRLAKYYGLPVPTKEADGSMISDLATRGRWETIVAYAKSDIEVTRSLYKFYEGYFV